MTIHDGDIAARMAEGRAASAARHGAHLMRIRPNMEPENVTYWSDKLAGGEVRERGHHAMGSMVDANWMLRLPEAAFEWPIYQRGMTRGRPATTWPIFHADGFREEIGA